MTRPKDIASASPSPAIEPKQFPWPMGVLFGLILVALLVAYFPALAGDFLWDDAGHVTRPDLQSWAGLARIWFEPGVTQQYYPLLHSAFWMEHQLWGDATLGYHVVNVIWHAISACLFIAVLRRLAVPGAVLAGCVFALHPVAVESVAWIAEQKNTLSTLFYLAAALAWLRYEEDRRQARYAVATLWFVAALLTKTVTATLPAALLVIAWWRRGRLSWRGDILPLMPWLAIGAAAGLGTSWLEVHQIGAAGDEFVLGPFERALLAGRVVWFYLGKLIWPWDLAFFYPRWTIDVGVWWQWLFPVAVLAALAGGLWWSRRDRGPLTAALLFGGTLFPVLGFVSVYPFVFSYVADHFQYLASLGMIAFLTAAATQGIARLRWSAWLGTLLSSCLLLLLGILTWRQSSAYRDVFSLYEATLSRSPDSWVAHLNLGTELDDAGLAEEALPHLQRALELKPDFPQTLNSLGNVLNRVGRPREALPLLERAIQLQPRFATAHNTLGVVFMKLGRTDAGLESFRRALAIEPAAALPRVNLAWGLAQSDRMAAALSEFAEARRRHPKNSDVELKWGLALASHGRGGEAVSHLSRAVELMPGDVAPRFALGTALWGAGRHREAVEQFQEVLRLEPDHAGARQALAAIRGTR